MYLLQSNPEYKKLFEERSCKIASQALSIEAKVNLKDLFPLDLFIGYREVSNKEFYEIAYTIMRPHLMKIMRHPDSNIHGLAIIYRFGFGSDNLYYYKVYEDFIRVLLEDYSKVKFEEKRIFQLAEKIRTNFPNIKPENRSGIFQNLMLEVTDEKKRKALVKEIEKVVERREQMITGEAPNN